MSGTNKIRLTGGQRVVLAAATVPMVAAGGFGAWGTYTNVLAEFGRGATAAGVVAAGEGVTLVLALVMVGLTMLGQAAPLVVRAGLWAAPVGAAVVGLAVADTGTERVVYAMTPMAMCASAEGLGLLARRIVVHRTGVDMEVQRANAVTVQRLAYHRARAVNHPSEGARKRSERAAWRLAKRVGVGDDELGARLVDVQRERLQEGADAALLAMLGDPQQRPEFPSATEAAEPEAEQATERETVPTEAAGPETEQVPEPEAEPVPDTAELAPVPAATPAFPAQPRTEPDDTEAGRAGRNKPAPVVDASAGQTPVLTVIRNSGGTRADHIRALVSHGVTGTADIRNTLAAAGIPVPSDRYIRRLVSEARNTDVPATGTTGTHGYM